MHCKGSPPAMVAQVSCAFQVKLDKYGVALPIDPKQYMKADK
jgi:hypothetical protein